MQKHSMDFSHLLHPKLDTAFYHFVESIKKHKTIFVEAAIGTLVMNIIAISISLYSMQVYDRVIPNNGTQTLWVLTIGVIIAIVIEFIIKEARAMVVEHTCKAIDIELSDFFFTKALNVRMDQRPLTIGTFAAQLRLYESVRNFMTSTTLFLIADIPFAFIYILIIALICGPLALIPLILFPIAVSVGLFFKKPIEELTNKSIIESTQKNGLLIESIDGIEVIKANMAEKEFANKWHNLTESILKADFDLKKHSTFATGLAQTIQQVAYIAIVATGVYEIMSGNLTMGGLLATTIISQRALTPAIQIVNLLSQWEHTKMAIKGLDAILKLPSDGHLESPTDKNVKPQTCRGDLLLNSLKYAYGTKGAIAIGSLEIKAGEKVAIIGTIGAGKSTLLKVLSGLYKPSEGRAFLDHVDMSHLDPEYMRQNIAYLPQSARLFNGTLRENLVIGMQSDPGDEAILNATRACGFLDVIVNHPKGIGMEITEGGHGMSGGQKQLASIAKLLLSNNPSVVLLDEPTSSLDGGYEERAINAIFSQFSNSTIVYATHKVNLLAFASRIIVMHNGVISMDGPRDQILAKLNAQYVAQKPN